MSFTSSTAWSVDAPRAARALAKRIGTLESILRCCALLGGFAVTVKKEKEKKSSDVPSSRLSHEPPLGCAADRALIFTRRGYRRRCTAPWRASEAKRGGTMTTQRGALTVVAGCCSSVQQHKGTNLERSSQSRWKRRFASGFGCEPAAIGCSIPYASRQGFDCVSSLPILAEVPQEAPHKSHPDFGFPDWSETCS